MALEDVCVHVATPLLTEEKDDAGDPRGDWVEGEFDDAGVPPRGTPFDCCLFLPLGSEEDAPRGGRSVRRPTLLYLPEDQEGGTVALSHEDELLIVAAELNEAQGLAADEEVRWQVDGKAQPFGPPGDDVIGLQARLVKVED